MQHLSSLILHGCNQVPAGALADLLEGLPSLIKLDLADTQCDRRVLSVVGSCCSRLRELDITACKRVTPDALLHLAYNPTARSFCCSALQVLEADGLEPHNPFGTDVIWALVFVLLALPKLRFLIHDTVVNAVCVIYHQRFAGAWTFRGFPSHEQVMGVRMSTHAQEGGSSGVTLDLRQVGGLNLATWPMVRVVCPHLEDASFLLMGNFDLGPICLTWRHLARLAINCGDRRDLKDFLPVTATLGAQLQHLSFEGFFLADGLSFHTLLAHCQNIQYLRVFLEGPDGGGHNPGAGGRTFSWGVTLPPLSFPNLCEFSMLYSSTYNPSTLEESLISLLRHSPCLRSLDLVLLPFSVDRMFQQVLAPPAAALRQLHQLILIQNQVSVHTLELLIHSENKLGYVRLDSCSGMDLIDYEELVERILQEGLDVCIVWK